MPRSAEPPTATGLPRSFESARWCSQKCPLGMDSCVIPSHIAAYARTGRHRTYSRHVLPSPPHGERSNPWRWTTIWPGIDASAQRLSGALATSIIGDDRPVTLEVVGDGGALSSRQAESIGLITTELVMNCF